jgi:hypothetical protein
MVKYGSLKLIVGASLLNDESRIEAIPYAFKVSLSAITIMAAFAMVCINLGLIFTAIVSQP